MKNRLDNLLKETLVALYYDLPEVVHALQQIDFSVVNRNFKNELFSRISEEDFYKVDEYLHSDEYFAYKDAIDQASMTVTTELAALIEFVTTEKGGKIN